MRAIDFLVTAANEQNAINMVRRHIRNDENDLGFMVGIEWRRAVRLLNDRSPNRSGHVERR